MYSVVLMMAMTSGADVPVDGLLHHNSCCGGGYCSGSYACSGGYCSGSYGGGYSCSGSSCHGGGLFGGHGNSCCGGGGLFGGHSSCHGGGGMLFGGHHNSCCGGGYCSGSYGSGYGGYCSGSYGSGYGGYCSGSYGGGYGGCCGGYGGGCYGGYVVPPTPMPEKKPEDGKKPVGEVTQPTPATIIVALPADAKLLVDGAATKSTSAERTFVSPALLPGNVYNYTLRAEFTKDGQPVSVTKTIEVRAGMETRVTIDMTEAVATR